MSEKRPRGRPKGSKTPNAAVTTLSAKVSFETVSKVKRAAEYEGTTPSRWVLDAINMKLATLETLVVVKKKEEAKLLNESAKLTPYTPAVYKDNTVLLKDLAFSLGVSYLYMYRRLTKGESLAVIVSDLESK